MSNCEAGYFHRPTTLQIVGVDPLTDLGKPPRVALIAPPILEHRLSVGLQARVLPRGIFLFDFEEWKTELSLSDRKSDDRLAVQAKCASLLNVHLACLYTAIHNSDQSVVIPRHMHISCFDMILLRHDAVGSPAALYEMSPHASEELVHWLGRPAREFDLVKITIETISQSFELFDRILEIDDDYVVTVVELLLRARNSIEESDYVVSLMLAWAAIEQLLNALWERFIAENRIRIVDGQSQTLINVERKKRLTSQDFTASIVSEILSLSGNLPFDLFEQITQARRARNAWLHRLESVKRKDAEAAIGSARQMLKLVHHIELRWYFVHHSLRG
jgi:hypothetical protein